MLNVHPWHRQIEICQALTTHDRVAVRSGHKVGKSTAAAGLALWWWFCWPDAKVVLTSASFRQVKNILWAELQRLYRHAPIPLGGDIHESPEAGLKHADGRTINGFSTNEPERMAGISGPKVLFIVDEASGVPEEIFQALEGNRAGGAKIVLFSNPTRTVGTFYDAFHSKRQFWKCIHISSREAALAKPHPPGLAQQSWIEEKDDEWGRDSPLTQVRVDGNFPTQGDKAVISLALVSDAVARWDEDDAPARGALDIGVDVARFGDDETVLAPVRGGYAYPITTLKHADGNEIAGAVFHMVRSMRSAEHRDEVRVKIDVIGVGATVYDAMNKEKALLKELKITLFAVQGSETATNDTYSRLRDQLWYAAKEWLKDAALPDDGALQSELIAAEFGFDTRGKLRVTDKAELKRALGRSPDRADALCLAVYTPPVFKPKRSLSSLQGYANDAERRM